MSIASIQSLIQKYGPNFGLAQPNTKAEPDASGSTSTSASAAAARQADKDAAGALGVLKTSAKRANGDTVSLSPQAMDYLASHTGALGKFEMPNMVDYFFDASEGAEASNDSVNDLAKLLGQHGEVSGSSHPAGDPFSSLSGFL
jgi:hypothetical protein